MELSFFLYLMFFMLFILVFLLLIYHQSVKTDSHTSSMPVLLQSLNQDLLPLGFQYSLKRDHFYSVLDGWQRNYGFCRLSEELYRPSSMIVDCDCVYFQYGKRLWLIEFRKGQFGICAGAEAGIYSIDRNKITSAGTYDSLLFQSIEDLELLAIEVTLFHDGKIIAKRRGKHWRLSIFRPGYYADPDELSAKISITFPNSIMRDAYLSGLKESGYLSEEITLKRLTVSVAFHYPKTIQPVKRSSLTAKFILYNNKICCEEYHNLTHNYGTTLEKLEYLRINNPELYALVWIFTNIDLYIEKEWKEGSLDVNQFTFIYPD